MSVTSVIPARELEPGMALGDTIAPAAMVVCVEHAADRGGYAMLRVYTADRRTMRVSYDALVEVTERDLEDVLAEEGEA